MNGLEKSILLYEVSSSKKTRRGLFDLYLDFIYELNNVKSLIIYLSSFMILTHIVPLDPIEPPSPFRGDYKFPYYTFTFRLPIDEMFRFFFVFSRTHLYRVTHLLRLSTSSKFINFCFTWHLDHLFPFKSVLHNLLKSRTNIRFPYCHYGVPSPSP